MSEFRGRLVEGTDPSYDEYVVEITNLPERSMRERADVMPDGTFVFRSVADGDYMLGVLTLYGVEIMNSVISVGSEVGSPYEIRLPHEKLQKPVTGTISIQQLNHPLSRRVRRLLESGQKLIDDRHYSDAAARFREAVHDDPQSLQAHADLGLALARMGVWDGAIEAYRSATVLDPRNSVLHSNLSSVLASANRVDEAESEASIALKLDPANGRAHYVLAGLLLHVPGRLEEVVSHLVAAENTLPPARTALEKICAVKSVQGCP
jgi:tetratricopeptide (TPR) repeat protein